MASGQASSCTAARQFGSGRRHEHQLHHDFSVLDGLTGKSARGGESAAERSSYQRVPPVEQLLNSGGIFWSRVDGDIDETGVFCFSFAPKIETYGHACTNTCSTRVLLSYLTFPRARVALAVIFRGRQAAVASSRIMQHHKISILSD